jgi:hypothetical protein
MGRLLDQHLVNVTGIRTAGHFLKLKKECTNSLAGNIMKTYTNDHVN